MGQGGVQGASRLRPAWLSLGTSFRPHARQLQPVTPEHLRAGEVGERLCPLPLYSFPFFLMERVAVRHRVNVCVSVCVCERVCPAYRPASVDCHSVKAGSLRSVHPPSSRCPEQCLELASWGHVSPLVASGALVGGRITVPPLPSTSVKMEADYKWRVLASVSQLGSRVTLRVSVPPGNCPEGLSRLRSAGLKRKALVQKIPMVERSSLVVGNRPNEESVKGP